jgi:hypothetical protein
VERASRHGPLPSHDAVRKLLLDQPAAAPADGVRLDVDAVALRQGPQCPVAEGADTRRKPEQGRGIERNPHACRFHRPGHVRGAQVVIAPSMERIAPVM